MCIAQRSEANTDKVMHEIKGKSLETRELFVEITYYKLQTRKHFVYYIVGLGGQGYRASNELVLRMTPKAEQSWPSTLE